MVPTTHSKRPRELRWYHAGPMLYGDWGTSRFYVLGLAFYYALYASFWYVVGVGVLIAAVGWAYSIICRSYPDGGGVYSAARQISPTLSVIGALLLYADFAVTAALSAFDGMSYCGADGRWTVALGACGAIVTLGAINFVGPKKAGTFALLCAGATLFCTLILVAFSIPHLRAGWANIQTPHAPLVEQWKTLVNVVLALSGVEAVANMTGIMVQPVARTAKKSIYPVLVEVVGFNILLAVAMLALTPPAPRTDFKQPAAIVDAARRHFAEAHPAWNWNAALRQQHDHLPEASPFEEEVKNRVLKVMGEQFVAKWFGTASGIVFGLLLFSAVNTVLGGMVSICFVMANDNELPHFFQKLNPFGVPWVGLLPAVAIPVVLLMLFSNLESLADLYAIGVVGAIAINLSSCTINAKLSLKRWERAALGALGVVMIAIELTLAWEKHAAVVFVSIVLVAGLGMRFITRHLRAARAKRKAIALPPIGLAGAIQPTPAPLYGTPAEQLDMSLPHVMVATRGLPGLIEFAARYTHKHGGILFVMYIRHINLPFAPLNNNGLRLEEDDAAQRTFATAMAECTKLGVPMVPLYVVSSDVAESILDFAATYNVEALLLGISRHGKVIRALQGNTISAVAERLPAEIPLLIHA